MLILITWAQWGFQDALSPLMEEFLYFHDFLILILCLIFTSTIWILLKTTIHNGIRKSLTSHNLGECLWTIYPACVLLQIGVPSLTLLYILDETTISSQVSLKAIGHQWYWSYEYTDRWSKSPTIRYDSYIIPSSEAPIGGARLLEVDNRTPLPYNVVVRAIVSSSDVLHSWALPSLGVKVDACPGRLNQQAFIGYRPGVYFGQCSEICGSNHSFMPIVIEFISCGDYFWWANRN